MRTESHAPAKQLSDRLRGQDGYPSVDELLYVSATVVTDALTVFERSDDRALSFTDATCVALLERHDIGGILSFDDDFDGIVHRSRPEDV